MGRPLRLAGLLAVACALGAAGHELPANRLTVVAREGHHLTLTFLLDPVTTLHRALAPTTSLPEFVLEFSAMEPAAFRKALGEGRARLQAATGLTLAAGQEARVEAWTWPDAGEWQARLRERAMQALVDPLAHPHDAPIEVRAEATTPVDIDTLTLRLPVEFQPLMVVSYRPRQVWVEPGTPSIPIRF